MTAEEVRTAVQKIDSLHEDPESAHAAEDALYQNVLAAIAAGTCENPAMCAKEALKTQDIEFPRWCA